MSICRRGRVEAELFRLLKFFVIYFCARMGVFITFAFVVRLSFALAEGVACPFPPVPIELVSNVYLCMNRFFSQHTHTCRHTNNKKQHSNQMEEGAGRSSEGWKGVMSGSSLLGSLIFRYRCTSIPSSFARNHS